MADRICVECKHLGYIEIEPYCMNPKTITKSIITGIPIYSTCKEQRLDRIYTYCRSEGKGFEKKKIQGSYGGEV